LFRMLETVTFETPARLATSSRVIRRLLIAP
jgi:hypothetical protein